MTLQLRVDGVYRSRAGEKVVIVSCKNSLIYRFCFMSTVGNTYEPNGKFTLDSVEDGRDLIAEWDEPAVDFSGDQLIESLQDAIAVLEARIAALEPTPKVDSLWHLVGPGVAYTFDSLAGAREECEPSEFIIRHDTILAADGSVTYACEVEK